MKRLIKWVLLNYGTQKATRFVDHLKTLGFHSATTAGISLGIDDLRIPPIKSVFLQNAEQDILDNDVRYQRGQITAVERLEKALDIWNTTNDTLKNEVISHFRETDIFNPVYMMAFSGARGNISQVRQLVGMRGLMADQQGQVLDFPIRRNFREGLTVTEYMISCYGARKGLVDTALRTANSGYLTRRLVDVAQSVIIQQFDCGTTEGLEITPSPKNGSAHLVGRVLLQPVVDERTGKCWARKNTEISPSLANQLSHFPKVVVRSPLTCRLNAVCQLCYGWDLSKYKLVQLGEAVGVLAAQSIGEPGTQLTMRTFHTGGVFAGEATEKVYAPYSGVVSYSSLPRGRKVLSQHGEPAFLTVVPVSLKIERIDKTKSGILHFPAFTLLFVYPGQYVMFHQSIAELSRIETETHIEIDDSNMTVGEKQLFASDSGQVYFENVKVFPKQTVRPKVTKSTPAYIERYLESPEKALQDLLPPNSKRIQKDPDLVKRTHNEVFGYGFMWLLSGYRMGQHVRSVGDYFQHRFQPLTVPSINAQMETPDSADRQYARATKNTILSYGVLRSRQRRPCRTLKTMMAHHTEQFGGRKPLWTQASRPLASGHGTFRVHAYQMAQTKTRTCPATVDENIQPPTLSPSSAYVTPVKGQWVVPTHGHQSTCTVSCTRMVTRQRDSHVFRAKRAVRGNTCFYPASMAIRIRHSTRMSRMQTREAQRFPMQTQLAPSAIILQTPYKQWTTTCQQFPDMELTKSYNQVTSVLAHARRTFLLPRETSIKGNALPNCLPLFTSMAPRVSAPWTCGLYASPLPYTTLSFEPEERGTSLAIAGSVEGEIRLSELMVTPTNQYGFACNGKKCVVPIGSYIRSGDEIIEGVQSPYAGQIMHVSAQAVLLRRVYPYAMSHGSSLFVNHGDFISKGFAFGTLVSRESTAGDIVQGLPKVDELLEAREPVDKMFSSIHAELATLFLLYAKTYGVREGCRRSLQAIRRRLVNEVQGVYQAQGVYISDKHIEIIVRQMTTYVVIIDPADTNLLPGDIIDFRRVEHFSGKESLRQVEYRPILLGITRASLAAESFIAAASFQETKRVLTRAAVEGRIDWLTGLKENVILGRLIPAGTGLYV